MRAPVVANTAWVVHAWLQYWTLRWTGSNSLEPHTNSKTPVSISGVLREDDLCAQDRLSPSRCDIMHAFVIRPCRRRDVLGLLLLKYATMPDPHSTPLGLAREYYSMQQRLKLNHVVVASHAPTGQIVGSVEVHSVQFLREQAGDAYSSAQAALLQPYLCSLFVKKGMRKQGIGRALVLWALKEAHAAAPPGSCIILNVEADNHAAIKLYRSRRPAMAVAHQRQTQIQPPSLHRHIPNPSAQVMRIQGEWWRRQSVDAETTAPPRRRRRARRCSSQFVYSRAVELAGACTS